MSETASTGAEANATTSGEGAPQAPAQVTAPVEVTTVEQLPEFAQKLITQLRQENAAARVKTNEKVEGAKLKTTQEFEAALAESNTNHETTKAQLAAASMTLAKLDAAVAAGIPSDKLEAVVSRLNGNTPEELKADVEVVKALFNIGEPAPRTPAVDPSQGKGATQATESGDAFTDMLMGLWNESR